MNVGIYRGSYPVYSETFIANQLNSYEIFKPTIFCNDYYGDSQEKNIRVRRGGKWNKLNFLAFGNVSCFDFSGLSVDILHAHFAQDALMGIALAERLDVPMVTTCHGSDITLSNIGHIKTKRLSSIFYAINKNKLFSRCDLFLGISDFMVNKMIEKGVPESKIVKHYIGLDTDLYSPAVGLKSGSDVIVLSVARHTDVKGIDILLKAFSIVRKKNKNVRLVQIGAGPLFKYHVDLAEKLGISRYVDFKGGLDKLSVIDWMKRSDVFVLSSRVTKDGAEEGLGMVMLEAASCGLPCVGTRVGGISETMIDGVTGYLAQSDNFNDLAEKIYSAINNNSMGIAGRFFVKKFFEIRKQTNLLENMYINLITGK